MSIQPDQMSACRAFVESLPRDGTTPCDALTQVLDELDALRNQEPVAHQYLAHNGKWYTITEGQAHIAAGEFDRPTRKLYAEPKYVPYCVKAIRSIVDADYHEAQAAPNMIDAFNGDAPMPAPIANTVAGYRIHVPQGKYVLTDDGGLYERSKRLGLKIDWLVVSGGISAVQQPAGEEQP